MSLSSSVPCSAPLRQCFLADLRCAFCQYQKKLQGSGDLSLCPGASRAFFLSLPLLPGLPAAWVPQADGSKKFFRQRKNFPPKEDRNMSDVRESRHCPLFMPENRRIFQKKRKYEQGLALTAAREYGLLRWDTRRVLLPGRRAMRTSSRPGSPNACKNPLPSILSRIPAYRSQS